MTNWHPPLDDHTGPRYRRIVEAMTADIASGVLPIGTRLPTHRDLAYHLGCTVGTVTRAYAEAQKRGLVEATVGRGTFVVDPRARTTKQSGFPDNFVIESHDGDDVIDLTLILPYITDAHRRLVAETLHAISNSPSLSGLLTYNPASSQPHQRRAAAQWIARGGLKASPDRVVITNGTQHGMDLILSILTRPGDVVASESLTYPGLRAQIAAHHLDWVGLPMDDEGIIPQAFEEICRTHAPRVLYCIPTLQNPTMVNMSEERRRAIAAIAERHGVYVIEDDTYGLLPETPRMPLCAYLPDLGLYVTSLAKAFAPGLRVGFIHAPDALVDRLTTAVRANCWMIAPIMVELVTRLIDTGQADAILAQLRIDMARRQEIARRTLTALPFPATDGAPHLWCEIPAGWQPRDFVDACKRKNVLILGPELFSGSGRTETTHCRICIGGNYDDATLEAALRTVNEIALSPPTVELAVI